MYFICCPFFDPWPSLLLLLLMYLSDKAIYFKVWEILVISFFEKNSLPSSIIEILPISVYFYSQNIIWNPTLRVWFFGILVQFSGCLPGPGNLGPLMLILEHLTPPSCQEQCAISQPPRYLFWKWQMPSDKYIIALVDIDCLIS